MISWLRRLIEALLKALIESPEPGPPADAILDENDEPLLDENDEPLLD